MNPTLQFLIFIVGFFIILGLFIRLIQIAEKRLGGKVPNRRYSGVMSVIISGMVLGIVMMFQPVALALMEPGFLLLLISTLAFILWSHVWPAPVLQPHSGEAAER
ncbi:MAG: hypothetical protein CUN48_08230 [Candidatus Thermofonsia Clade 3 bacterium]|jgi:hypothetical protein|uniref:Uncharacterized protein n=1 Tax=Candidatus Thermofonsia Clade 3 bacterium TaxID=2364212 RepID=A0A2M8QCK1_9CHLR|nr:hypothetical protein [Candidatus Roseilinea sp. NK_OTU-006]PJF47524.1 MAG: hypothetical protein CUN48_08230 [Candidatus Thermofonsia Clade 3 bacterium]